MYVYGYSDILLLSKVEPYCAFDILYKYIFDLILINRT